MDFIDLESLLASRYQVSEWWPGDSPFEVAVGAILTQQTNWTNVLTVLDSIKDRGFMDPDSLAEADLTELEGLMRPVGFYRQKAERAKGLARYIRDAHGSDIMSLLRQETHSAREELLGLKGIGRETADSILAFGAGHPVFISAAYCIRIFNRTGVNLSKDYEEVREAVEADMGPDPMRLRSFYALLVEHAKTHCRAKPLCEGCVLAPSCPFRP